MGTRVTVLVVEDVSNDAELMIRELRKGGYEPVWREASSEAAFIAALDDPPEVILADQSLPGFSGSRALTLLKGRGLDIPFIVVTAALGDEKAAECIKLGAADYLLKDRLARLPEAVRQALQKRQARNEQERLGRALGEAEERFRSFMQHLAGRASIRDRDGRYIYVNDNWLRAFGLQHAAVVGRRPEEIFTEDRAGPLAAFHRKVLETNAPQSRIFRTDTDNDVRWWISHYFPIPAPDGQTAFVGSLAIDITEQKKQEEGIRRLNRIHAVLSSINSAIIRLKHRQDLLQEACRIAVEHGNFDVAWVGICDPVAQVVRPVAWAGTGAESLVRSDPATTLDAPYGRGVTGKTVQQGVPVWIGDLTAERSIGSARRQAAISLGLRSAIGLPLLVEGAAAGVLTLYSRETSFFDDEEVALLMELVGNISFTLESLGKEEKIARLSRIQAVMSDINALIVRVRERAELFKEACRIAVEQGKFGIAWIGALDPDTLDVTPVAWAGLPPDDLLVRLKSSARPDHPGGQGVVGRAIRERRPVFENDVLSQPGAASARKQEAARRGYHSRIALPLSAGGRIVAVIVLYAKDPDFFNEAELKLLSELSNDISFAMEHIRNQETLNYLAYYDMLTGLPNRSLFVDRLGQQLRGRAGEPVLVAVALIDLERFRNVNETLGRPGGDELLKLIAHRLADAFSGNDSIARTAADGFGLVMRGGKDAASVAHAVEERLLGCFQEPYKVHDSEVRVAAKAGIAMFPADGQDPDTLFKNAEAALKKAKESGERYLFYAADMNAKAAQALLLETRLRNAVESRQFVLHYQPKIDLASGALAGVEALIRWQEPGGELVPPGVFIPVLEETGLILAVGRWVIEQALSDYREWSARGLRPPRIAVNVSAIQLQQRDFADMVIAALKNGGGNPAALELEVTESLIMRDLQASIRKLSILRELGIHIAMDDFGTGYSSLSYIARLPITSVKIDRSFVSAMEGRREDMAIVTTIVALAHSLNLRVVAEGVETHAQSQLLKLLKCDEAQGFLFSKPLPANALVGLLQSLGDPAHH